MSIRDCLEKSEYEFILLFNKATGSDRIYYFIVDPRSRDRMYPKMNTTVFYKLRNLTGYRPIVLGGMLYIVGGKNWNTGEPVKTTWRYDPDTMKWTARANLNEERCRFTADILDDKIYITGGEVRHGKVTDSVEIYDPVKDTWCMGQPLPRPRVDHASCVCNNRLYVSGGISNIKHQCSNIFWVYDILTDEWVDPCPGIYLPDEREKHLMIPTKENEIVIMAGRGFDQEIFQEKDEGHMCSYPTQLDGLVKRPRCWDMEHPHMFNNRVNPGYVTLGRRVFLFGGKSFQKDKEVTEVDFYNVKTRKWRTVFNLPTKYSYANLDCVILKIPVHNRDFNFNDIHLYDKWIMW